MRALIFGCILTQVVHSLRDLFPFGFGITLPDKDFGRSFQEIVEANDYLFEDHFVITEDGYILNVFRIKGRETEEGAPVVFLQHGILDTADAWIVHEPSKSPAF